MKPFLLSTVLLFSILQSFAQQTDIIVLKKQNNRTLKTFGPGTFMSARLRNGFNVNGMITAIRHDSVYVQQVETRLVPTELGSTIDTLKYTVGFDYKEIARFNYDQKNRLGSSRKKGFAEVALPKILMIGGVGFIVLELVNTIYRGESLNENNKLPALGVAAGVAAAGFLINYLNNRSEKKEPKYQVLYIKAGTIRLNN